MIPQEQFFSYLKFEKRYSPHTLSAYRRDLDQFMTYLKINDPLLTRPADIKPGHIRGWMIEMLGAKVTPRSVNRKLSTLKTWFRFLRREGLVKADPLLKVVAPKTSKRLPVYAEEHQMESILAEPHLQGFEPSRDHLIMELLYSTGIRLSELINLRHRDLAYNPPTIIVMGKGSKERMIPISPDLLGLIEEYIETKKGLPQGGNDPLFMTGKGNPLYPMFVYRVVKSVLSRFTNLNKRSPHILRHTFATHLLNNGADLNAIKELLGHASLAATQVYTHNSIEKLKEIYRQAHPKA